MIVNSPLQPGVLVSVNVGGGTIPQPVAVAAPVNTVDVAVDATLQSTVDGAGGVSDKVAVAGTSITTS